MKLTEQIYFAPGESFWVVVHFPGGQSGYPLGLATVEDAVYSGYSYMSNDMGKTWHTMADALHGSPYESISNEAGWAITAVSQNPAWDKIITLSPASGQVKYGEKQDVVVTNDGQPLVNGTYKFNLHFNTNESEKNTKVVPITMTVSGYAPEMVPAKVVNFGNLLVGESKTITVEVFNEGYGVFGYYGSLSGNYISSTSEHFQAPTYISGGFPARSYKTFDVVYAPQSAGSHTGNIVFKHSDGTEFKVTVTGVATDPAKIEITPDTVAVGILGVDSAAITKELAISNVGNYPLEFVFPKFSNRQLENQGKAAHKFGYVAANNLNGATSFEYDGNPTLIGGTNITSSFDDNTYLSKQIALGFEFPFYGKGYDYAYITSYGGIAFGTGEYAYRSPLTESSYGLEGVPYISAYGYQLAMGPQSKVEYAKQDGKFVVKYTDVLALVYDQEYTPISFRIALSANGDIEIFYDSYNPSAMNLFQAGSTLYCGILDGEGNDPLTITSADIADFWETSADPAGYVYKYFTNKTAVKFIAPKPNFIAALKPAYGIVNPGESINIAATLKADATMYAGKTYNNLVLMSNDPYNGTSYVRFEANISGEQLQPKSVVDINTLDFGEVFRTSVAQLPVTVKNAGQDTLLVNKASVSSPKFKVKVDENAAPFTLAPGMAKDIIVTLLTDNEGGASGNLLIETSTGTHTVALLGQVIGCPAIDLSSYNFSYKLASGAALNQDFTITNSGNETLTYSIIPNPEYFSFNDHNEGANVVYSYSASIDDPNVTFNWIDIETTGLGKQNNFTYYYNHDYAEVELPFEFPYYGKKYNKMYIYNTGFVSFTKRNDDKVWPEPPAEFPAGTIYTNIIAPYWGLHTCDQSKTAGTYHYVTSDEVIVSWMEYGNSMNSGVCYQLIMKKDGSFKYQYKPFGDYAVIYGVFGLAGLSNEDGSEGLRLPERYVAFNNAVQFYPVVENNIMAEDSRTIGLNFNTNKLAGEYSSNIEINTNVPKNESIKIPIKLSITGEAKPVFPTDSIIVERVLGHMDDPSAGPLTTMGANYEACFYIKNEGTAPFTISHIKNGGPSMYDEWFDQYYPLFNTYYEADEIDWITGEPTGNKTWTQYPDYTPITIGTTPQGISIPVLYDIANQAGVYDIPLTFYYNDTDEAVVNVRFIVTPAPQLVLDKEEVRVTNATNSFIGTDSVAISNNGEYRLSYELRLDPTGVGEQSSTDNNGGIAPASTAKNVRTLTAEADSALSQNIFTPVKPLEKEVSVLDAPQDFTYRNILYYPTISGNNTTYQYGAGNTFSEYKAATYYVAPEEGFNLSHIYTATYLPDLCDVDIKVEIIKGNDPEGTTILGKGTFHIDEMESAKFLIIPLDRAVYLAPGQDFYVVITYPAGVEYPAYLTYKEEGVESNRFMGFVDGYGWFDLATMFEDTYGSLGYIMTCLETKEGNSWVKMLNPDSDKVGVINPGESLNVKFQFSAEDAPMDKDNKAVLVIKSNDPNQPIVNFPIVLDKNAAPTVTAPSNITYAKEGALTQIAFTVIEPENDDFSLRLDDNGNIAKLSTVTPLDGQGEIEISGNTATVKGVTDAVKVVANFTPEFGTSGSYALTLTATDTYGNESEASARYLVEHVNQAPRVIATEDYQTMMATTVSDIISFADFFTDPDGDELRYEISVTPDDIVTAFKSDESVIFVANKVGVVIVRITATDPSGASAVYAYELEVTEFNGVESITIDSQVNVYPNPVVSVMNVVCDFNNNDANYCIYGANGAVVYNKTTSCISGQAHVINVDNLPAGLYLLKVTTEQGVANYPIIKK